MLPKPSMPEIVSEPTQEPSTADPQPKDQFRDKPAANGSKHCTCSTSGRNLVVCIDGTANQFGVKNTNVVELYSRLVKDKSQLTYYNSGIGTYAKPSWKSLHYRMQRLYHFVDMAIAWNFERIVLSAYRWLSENYEDGDRIFLFGFSRGAYQIRVIAGMIERVGLLHKGNNDQIPFAYELYTATTEAGSRANPRGASDPDQEKGSGKRSQKEDPIAICKNFKKTLSRPNVKVHFVGAWDTVSSIGFAREPSLPETTSGMRHVCVFRHALALDERRLKFLPEYVNGGAGPELVKADTGPEPIKGATDSEDRGEGDVVEVWFPGSHSDIGGGIVNNENMDLFDPSLRWMTYNGISHGLKMNPFIGKWSKITPHNSLTGIWKVLEVLPLKRLSYKGRSKEATTHWPHLGGSRKMQPGQKIHASVFELMGSGVQYTPKARIHDGLKWHDKELQESERVEDDPYISVSNVLKSLIDKPGEITDAQIDVLASLSGTEIGRRSINELEGSIDLLIEILETECRRRQESGEDGRREQLVPLLIAALDSFPPQSHDIRKYPIDQLLELKDMIEEHYPKHVPTLSKIIRCIGKVLIHGPFIWHRFSIPNYCAFSHDGKDIFLGSSSLWGIWEEGTDKPEQKSYGEYTGKVSSVAFSADGTRIATGLGDGMVLVWDSSTGEVVKGPLKEHAERVWAIAFSPDGTHIASGSDDCTIRVWDVTTGEVIGSMEGHTELVRCVAFSPNGTRIVSGSGDNTIRVWDVKTGNEVMEPLQGHTYGVLAVAYSPDGTRIVSGSSDSTIRVWNAGTGEEVMKPLEGHTSAVPAVTYSLDGRRIASGSQDETIRVWDTMTGEMLGVLNVGSDVWSVAFSPDGKRIVSGSWDYSTFNLQSFVHIWDAENPELWPDSHSE